MGDARPVRGRGPLVLRGAAQFRPKVRGYYGRVPWYPTEVLRHLRTHSVWEVGGHVPRGVSRAGAGDPEIGDRAELHAQPSVERGGGGAGVGRGGCVHFAEGEGRGGGRYPRQRREDAENNKCRRSSAEEAGVFPGDGAVSVEPGGSRLACDVAAVSHDRAAVQTGRGEKAVFRGAVGSPGSAAIAPDAAVFRA